MHASMDVFKCLLMTAALLSVGRCQEVDVIEPATIVIAPVQPEHTSGGRLTLTCVAYGQPLPTITWSIPSMGIMNFSAIAAQSTSAAVNIYTTTLDDRFTVSMLELCNVNYTVSMYGGFVCEANNGVMDGGRVLGQNRVTLASIAPIAQVPATLFVVPEGRYRYEGTGLVAECIVYGSPRPSVTWSSPALGITDFEEAESDGTTTTVVSRDVVVGGLIVTYSTLHICPSRIDTLSSYLVEIQCSTTNGLSPPIGLQSATFTASPFIEILAFDVTAEGASPAITFTFGGDYDPDQLGCFLDKLIFLNNPLNATVQFRPVFPGRCARRPGATETMIVSSLDPRDYLAAYNLGLFRDSMLYVATEPTQVNQFAPPLQLTPIELENALAVSNFVPNVLPPEVRSFDFDLTNQQLLIHFDSFIVASTFDPTFFTLQGTQISQDTGQRVSYVLATSRPQGIVDEHVQTICVTLSIEDILQMNAIEICTTSDNCAAYFTADLADGLNAMSVADRSPTNPLMVSHFRTPPQTERSLYMNVTLSYVGCEVNVTLTEDEIYITRVGEYVTRIDCFADGRLGNINPELTYEGNSVLSSTLNLDWPLHVSYSYQRGLTVDRAGQYVCRTATGNNITHYLQTENPYFRLLEGDSLTARLYDQLFVTVLFARQPPVNLQQTEIRLINSVTLSSPTVEPAITVLNNFKATIVYNQAVLSLTGSYNVQIVMNGGVVAQTPLSITVNNPIVNIVPPVATILPEHVEVVLRCETNSETLPILWVADNLITELSPMQTYRISIPASGFPDLTSFTCIVRNPEFDNPNPSNIVGRADAYVRNIPMPLTVYRDGSQELPDGHLISVNQISNLNLQCLGDATQNHVDLMWIASRDGEMTEVVMANSEFFQVQYNYNEANLTVINSARPFRGKLRCYSPLSGATSTIIAADNVNGNACPGGDQDPLWKIEWDFTVAGSQDIQPCPQIQGIQTFGFASRSCDSEGEWEDTVDITACSTASFNQLQDTANELTQNKDSFAREDLQTMLISITSMLNNVTLPKSVGSHFPADLNTANQVSDGIISILRESITEAVPLSLNLEMVKVFNNLLHDGNTEGWRQSQAGFNGGRVLLNNTENYGIYLAEALVSPTVDTSQYMNGIMLTESNVEYGVTLGSTAVNFPPGTSSFSPVSRIEITSAALTRQMAQTVISIAMNNMQNFLPQLIENNVTTQALTPVISSQICSNTNCPSQITFTGDDEATLFFTTTRTIGARNPRCVFWDEAQGKWSTQGVNTFTQVTLEDGEFKAYRLVCLSQHLSSFAVIADVEVTELEFYTIPIYIGCGIVVFTSFFAIFALILSCLTDSIRKYFTVMFLTHVSFIFSVLAAYLTYVIGVEMAVEERVSCIAVAGILQYFFTAAFAWLFCETLLVTLFEWAAKRCGAFILFFLIGWGLPAIPTAISLGLINEQYGTTAHCWFYFDGQFQSEIVLAFIVPILALIIMIIVFQITGCCKICSFMTKLMQGVVKKHTGRLLWYLWCSNVLFILLLGSSWVFAMLYVNVYALDSVILGWVFMACSTVLGIYIFVFSVSVVLMNQKVDYEYMHQEHTGLTYVRDPMKGSTYEMIDVPLPEGPVGRPRIIIPNPVFEDNYPSAYPKEYDDADDTNLIEADLGENEEEEKVDLEQGEGEEVDDDEEGEEEDEEEEEEEEEEATSSDDDEEDDERLIED